MNYLFAYRFFQMIISLSGRPDNRADSSCLDRTNTTDLSSAQARTVQFNSKDDIGDWTSHCAKYGFDIRATDTGILRRNDENDSQRQFVSGAENNGRKYIRFN